MSKALVNCWVDMVTGVAFLFCAITGIVRLLPEATTLTASGAPAILGVSAALWATIHDWSGAVMAAGVGVHAVLHLRRLAHMTRRVASGDTKRKARVAPAGGGRRTARVPATIVAAGAVGCGACLQVCPAGVFAFSGSMAVVQDPDACRLRGRCTHVCRPGAITLNAQTKAGGAALPPPRPPSPACYLTVSVA